MFEVKYYTGKKPFSYVLNGKETYVDTWAEMAIKLFEELYEFNSDIFETLAQNKFKNPKSPLIAKNDYDILNRSKKLNNTEIYIEMHHSTSSLLRFIVLVLDEYRMLDKFELKVKENNNG